jgi:hypothetical protein
MSLAWSKVIASGQSVYYDVYKSANGGASYSLINYADYLYDDTPSTITIHDTDVSFGTNYRYYVIAYVIEPISGTRTNSNAKYSGTVAHEVPVPGDFRAVSSTSPGTINLSWTGVSGADGYNLYRYIASGTPTLVNMSGKITSTSYTNSGLIMGTTYNYILVACYGSYQSNQTTSFATSN